MRPPAVLRLEVRPTVKLSLTLPQVAHMSKDASFIFHSTQGLYQVLLRILHLISKQGFQPECGSALQFFFTHRLKSPTTPKWYPESLLCTQSLLAALSRKRGPWITDPTTFPPHTPPPPPPAFCYAHFAFIICLTLDWTWEEEPSFFYEPQGLDFKV